MALKIKFRMPTHRIGWASLAIRIGLIVVAAAAVTVMTVGGYFYVKYQHVVDERLKQPLFKNTAKIFAEPLPKQHPQRTPTCAEPQNAGTQNSWVPAVPKDGSYL